MITENIKKVEELIARTCEKSNRSRSEIKLIAVSKTQPVNLIQEVLNAGIVHLGENKAQELRDKSEVLKGNFYWHYIGHLQSNKIKYVIKSAEYIHSVDSEKLAEEINAKAEQIGKKQKILLEVKTSGEATKYGLETELEISRLAKFCANLDSIQLCGLMTMAPYTEDKSAIRNCFRELRLLKDRLNEKGIPISELSMGMTNDFEIAIEEGATMLRIGTALFGERTAILK